MISNQEHGQESANFDEAKSEISGRLESEAQSAREALHDARDEIVRKAGDYASEAKTVLNETAEEAKRDITTNLLSATPASTDPTRSVPGFSRPKD